MVEYIVMVATSFLANSAFAVTMFFATISDDSGSSYFGRNQDFVITSLLNTAGIARG